MPVSLPPPPVTLFLLPSSTFHFVFKPPQDLTFYHWWCWRFITFGMSCRVNWQTVGELCTSRHDATCQESLFLIRVLSLGWQITWARATTTKIQIILYVLMHLCWPGSSVAIATGYKLDGPGIESRWKARFSVLVQTSPGAHPASCTMGTESFTGVKSGRGVTLTPHPLLVLWSWKSRAIPLLPLWAIRPVQSLSACTRATFTFFFTYALIYQPFKPYCFRAPTVIKLKNWHSAHTVFMCFVFIWEQTTTCTTYSINWLSSNRN